MDRLKHLINDYGPEILKNIFAHGLRILVILALFAALFFLLRFGLRKFLRFYLKDEEEGSEKEKRIKTLTRVLSVVGGVLLFATAAMMVVSELGIDIKPVIASLGIGGLAIGFGAQNLVRDVIAGFFILFEDQLRVGDVVKLGDHGGQVEKVGLRTVVLRDLSGNRIIIPNGEITKVVNMTYEFSRYVFDIGVAYKEDVDRVMEVMEAVGKELEQDPAYGLLIREPLEILGLDRFDDSAVIIRARITTRPLQQWKVAREFNRRLKKAFDREGIEIPFPHRTVYFAGDPLKIKGD